MSTVFKKTKEDFVCEHCGKPVVGNGYTNHCPECLWSKHVDVNPGDRAATCLGLMEPVGVTIDRDGYHIHHVCQKCGLERKNKSAPNDSFDALLACASMKK
jgi:rubrerythrin